MAFIDRETLVLTKNGVWLSNGDEITHGGTCKAFFKSLGRDEEGYFIQIGRDFKRIEVEDTAYFITGIEWKEDQVTLRISDDTSEKLDPPTLSLSPGRLICRIKNGKEEARFLTRSYYDLLLKAEESAGKTQITIAGKTYPLLEKSEGKKA